jgi:hypothetical protein
MLIGSQLCLRSSPNPYGFCFPDRLVCPPITFQPDYATLPLDTTAPLDLCVPDDCFTLDATAPLDLCVPDDCTTLLKFLLVASSIMLVLACGMLHSYERSHLLGALHGISAMGLLISIVVSKKMFSLPVYVLSGAIVGFPFAAALCDSSSVYCLIIAWVCYVCIYVSVGRRLHGRNRTAT